MSAGFARSDSGVPLPSATITKTPEKSPRNVLKTIQQNPTSAQWST